MNARWLLRMAKWGRNPPSERRVIFVFAIIGVCILLFAIERWVGWPEALTPNGGFGRGLR